LRGEHPEILGFRASLRGDRIEWFQGGAAGQSPTQISAGTGVAAQIVDLVTVAAPAREPGRGTEPGACEVGSDEVRSREAGSREREIPVDQTHTSVIVDERWVVKIVGEWGAADRAAAILDRLRRAGSTAIPDFAGTFEWEHPTRGTSVLALIAAYVPESEDGWTWAVDDVLEFLDTSAPHARGLPDWPARVGQLTAEMHAALRVSGAEPIERARADVDAVLSGLAADFESREMRSPEDRAFARRMRSRRRALAAAIETIPSGSDSPLVIPHGDFHVGQLLRTASGAYYVLDFDGDPQWSAERRLQPDAAAQDVAHMLASIDLVAAVVQRRLGRVDERAWQWSTAAQEQFLDAYRAAAEPGLLDERALPGLIAEQLLAELSYAERYQQRWRYAPDGVISRRYAPSPDPETVTGHPEESETPWNPPALPTT